MVPAYVQPQPGTASPSNLTCKTLGHKLFQYASDKRVEMIPEDPTKAIYTVIVYCARCAYNFEERQTANL